MERLLLGTNRTLSGGRTVYHELLMIEQTPEGTFYRAWPKGQAAASFRAVTIEEDRLVFEDPAHDFPQRILYERTDDGGLRTRIEGVVDGVAKSAEQRWTRARVLVP